MRDRNAKLRRDKKVLDHKAFVIDESFEMVFVKDTNNIPKECVVVEDIRSFRPKGRERFMSDLAKCYLRDFEITGNPQFENLARLLFKAAVYDQLPESVE